MAEEQDEEQRLINEVEVLRDLLHYWLKRVDLSKLSDEDLDRFKKAHKEASK